MWWSTFSFSVARVFVNSYQIRMSHKLAANLTTMFKEHSSLLARYKAAKDAGFKYVECAFPYGESLESIQQARTAAGVEQVLINAWPGDMKNGEIGLAALPNKVKEFREKLETSVEYAKALNCKRMHVMAGLKPGFQDEAMEEVFIENIRYAAERLSKDGIVAVIEPINNRLSIPKYFLTDIHKAVEYIKKIDHPNLKLQFDFFHIQIMDGNLTGNLKKYLPYIGHIQIAQVPDRGEPSDGEIDFKYIFKLLKEVGYDGYIGLEYNPRGKTEDGLKWIQDYGLTL
ncbi:putative hydroxypyruvate isomerase [Ylistrum balloti]|uniref:putative hydroxypyruvate isomerase n=1 Tax=Ylistrum balloti TaxID=509963 RepID=UPI0029058530|nr:putative hydroxypyruvate isomerase [Ylistrum balloti]